MLLEGMIFNILMINALYGLWKSCGVEASYYDKSHCLGIVTVAKRQTFCNSMAVVKSRYFDNGDCSGATRFYTTDFA